MQVKVMSGAVILFCLMLNSCDEKDAVFVNRRTVTPAKKVTTHDDLVLPEPPPVVAAVSLGNNVAPQLDDNVVAQPPQGDVAQLPQGGGAQQPQGGGAQQPWVGSRSLSSSLQSHNYPKISASSGQARTEGIIYAEVQ